MPSGLPRGISDRSRRGGPRRQWNKDEMIRNLLLLGAVLLSLTTAVAQAPRTVVVRAARMLDPVAGRIVPNPVVVVSGDRIQSVGGNPPAGAAHIDLGDLTLLPGLVDAHTHNL